MFRNINLSCCCCCSQICMFVPHFIRIYFLHVVTFSSVLMIRHVMVMEKLWGVEVGNISWKTWCFMYELLHLLSHVKSCHFSWLCNWNYASLADNTLVRAEVYNTCSQKFTLIYDFPWLFKWYIVQKWQGSISLIKITLSRKYNRQMFTCEFDYRFQKFIWHLM